ncbi:hypothetical protein SAY86_010663 [Trapa natans]|uniref:EF-hand domain-containing protein n=1 Tax=Trapa natans TaxID=22666 RepID=A0AAN7R3H4_TRANT|nr:hypothetical protein SAY86_010663 [Trapa natans]
MWRSRVTLNVLLVLMVHSATGRSIRGIISDGMDGASVGWRGGGALRLSSTTVTCTPTYGFLPCTTEVWGELFLIVVYEYLLAAAGHYIASGSDLFFRMFGTGIFGASLFQLLGTIPQVVIMLVSALSSSTDTIESMATMLMAMLAGSAILSLTLIWGTIVVFGSHDLNDNSPPSSSSSTTCFSLPTFKQLFSSSYGVKTDTETKKVARIVLATLVPFLILQLAKILSSSTAERIVILITLIIVVISLVFYCTYEVFQPWIQQKRYEYVLRKHLKDSLMKKYLTTAGRPNETLIATLFGKIDKNNDGKISESELYAFILGVQIDEAGLSTDDYTQKVMEEFDISKDSQISRQEFINGVSNWLIKASNPPSPTTTTSSGRYTPQGTTEERTSLISQVQTGTTSASTSAAATPTSTPISTTTPSGSTWWNYTKALFFIILGTGFTMLIGQPLMINIQDFASAIGIPSFFISYVVVPLAMSYRQAITAVTSARKMTVKDTSLSFTAVPTPTIYIYIHIFSLFYSFCIYTYIFIP